METLNLYLVGTDYVIDALHLLEKLVEWKLVDFISKTSRINSLHLLEKLVEWKL